MEAKSINFYEMNDVSKYEYDSKYVNGKSEDRNIKIKTGKKL